MRTDLGEALTCHEKESVREIEMQRQTDSKPMESVSWKWSGECFVGRMELKGVKVYLFLVSKLHQNKKYAIIRWIHCICSEFSVVKVISYVTQEFWWCGGVTGSRVLINVCYDVESTWSHRAMAEEAVKWGRI
jgi:hypothetical protein